MRSTRPTLDARRRGRRRLAGVGLATWVGLVAAVLVPAVVAAHPLGNFTINHYAGVRVEPDRILLDIVIDQAEIPTFQARLDFDTDGDGKVSDSETDAGRATACAGIRSALTLIVDGAPRMLTLTEAGLTFPPGVGGLSTMRLVCGFTARLEQPLVTGSEVTFADTSFVDRLGWREIVVEGSGVTLAAVAGELRTSDPSERLRVYPTNLLTQALADRSVAMVATPGGPTLAPLDIPDASPLTGSGSGSGVVVAAAATTPTLAGAVPGGVSGVDLPSIFRTADVTPLILLVSILTAAALGAGHALTPGHGKTLMAAYLVGTRGTPLHAAGLGLSVALSHTLGIMVLAGLVVGAQGILPPDVVVKSAPIVAAISIVAIGSWMLFGETRRRWRLRTAAAERAHEHDHGADHDHDHDAAEHSHGGVRHSHLPTAGSTISWRSLFVLGLAGGLIPSTNALLILLGSIAAGRPTFGFVLVVAFGLGMALVMGGIGLALVLARGRLDRVDATSRLGRISAYVPIAAAVLVFSLGIYLTIQAVAGKTTF